MIHHAARVCRVALPILLFSSVSFAGGSDKTHHDHHGDHVEEIVVSAPFGKTAAETALPITVLAGEALLEEVANTLGDTLKEEIGINSSSFGPSVGHPIIRGHTGNRVGILQNGIGTTDVSNQSQDHAEGVEVSLANRVEIIRGPASLLYGSGAIGGVVNVIDGRIPEVVPEKPSVMFEQTYNDNGSENRSVFRVDAGSGNFAFHLEGFRRDNDNIEIPGFAIDELAVEAQEELLHDAHGHEEDEHEGEEHGHEEDDHDHEEDEVENTFGFVGNSDSESDGGSIGFSFVTDRGFIGFSASRLDNDYGLPPGSHSHGHEEDHDEEHEGEEHEGEEEGEGHDEMAEDGHDEDEHGHGEEEVEFVRLDMEKTRYDLRAGLTFDDSWIESLNASFAYTDYSHNEIEFFEDGEAEVGTRFDNEGYEGRVTMQRRSSGLWSGVYGFQFTDNEFSAVGEESFIPKSDISNMGIFGFEQYQGDQFVVELGARFDSNDVETGRCESSETEFSASGSVLYELDDRSNFFVGLTRASRTPSVEELFANVDNTACGRPADDEELVLHAATNLLEIGNPNLSPETSNNFELGYRVFSGRVTGEISVYMNQIDDYIYLNVDGEEFEEQLIGEYVAGDAEFRGVEARLNMSLYESDNLRVNWSLFGDSVNAEFDAGGNIPRIPPSKIGTELEFFGDAWTFHVHAFNVSDQDDAGDFELTTDGYDLVSIYADYHWNLGNAGELKLFLRGDDLLDEEIRNHASLLKNYAPEPGRSYRVGLRFQY